jgi:hypothetical protein
LSCVSKCVPNVLLALLLLLQPCNALAFQVLLNLLLVFGVAAVNDKACQCGVRGT